jgi:DNA-binding NarL/FixJ family response regulator
MHTGGDAMDIEQLDSRDLQIWKLVVAGRSHADIARELSVNPGVVKYRMRSLCQKLGLDMASGRGLYGLLREAARQWLDK